MPNMGNTLVMESVSKRDVHEQTEAVLERVSEVGVVVVTERGTPMWRITAYRGEESVLDRLEREGHYSPPAPSPDPWPRHPGGSVYTAAEVDALLDDIRGDG